MLQIFLSHHHMVATPKRIDFAADVLLNAVDYESEETVRLIVDGGYSSVTVRNTAGEMPLHRAILKCNTQLMELLVGLDPSGVSLTSVTVVSESPVHYAARHGSVRVMETLLHCITGMYGDSQTLDENDNPLNATNREGVTGLYVAGMTGGITSRGMAEQDAIVELLQQHGARLFPRDRIMTPLFPPSIDLVLLDCHVRRGLVSCVQDASGRNQHLDDENGGDDGQTGNALLTELCAEWVSSTAVVPLPSLDRVYSPERSDLAGALLVVVSAGYALDLLPLLVELPVLRCAMSGLLHRLEHFARVPQQHSLLHQLYAELSEAQSEHTASE
ncbi:unnamed protein product [Phytophthora fragariaefolia]|uniref:Unnamed protein product n=1 Tax=Phytophthora fragariaefolia TaxID=1490495 RepID=A0A9W7CSB2_9STRA|nr:unnamed protein product [Phytophthora fragariaefolia]